MRRSFECDIPVETIRVRLKSFYENVTGRFPARRAIRASQGAALACLSCGNAIADVRRLDGFSCFAFSQRPGVSRLADCDTSDDVAFLRTGDHAGLGGVVGAGVEWCDLECSGCSVLSFACRVKLGAVMSVGTLDES